MAKRGHGEGSIAKRPDGTWWGRVTVGTDEKGNQVRKAYYGKTRKEVQDKVTAAINQVNKGTYIEPSSITLGEWLDIWLKEYKRNSIRITTYSGYRREIDNHVKPVLGKYPLKDLRHDMVQGFVNSLVEKGLGWRGVGKNAWFVKAALEQARKNGMLAENVALDVILPLREDSTRQSLSQEEQENFVTASKHYKNGKLFVLMLATGLRIGEALALTWGDIDFANQRLSVNKTQISFRDPDNPEAGHITTVGPPKTAAGNRTIPLLPVITEMLQDIRTDQSEKRSVFRDDLVFCSRTGKMLQKSSMLQTFRKIANRGGIKPGYSPHCLRHTFATRGLENGIPIRVMQELLGHASIKMTANLYTHVLPDTKKDFMLNLEATIPAIKLKPPKPVFLKK